MDPTVQHVKEMKKGTPLLLRKLGENAGQENLHIFVFQVDTSSKFLKWTETDGSRVSQVPISSIADVCEERSNDPEDMGGMIRVTFAEKEGSEPPPMDLIFASREDVVTWRDGLRYLVDAARSANGARSPNGVRSPSAAVAASKRPRTAGAGAPATEAPVSAGVGQLLERIQLQQELITELREENGVLNEIVKQKDDILKQKDLAIEHLMQELKSRGTKGEHCGKTESTSRESDDHLRDREMAILKRKNLKLKKMMAKKQQTIANLIATLQSAVGGQASDADMLRTEDDEEEADSDGAVGGSSAALAAASAAARALASGDSGSEPEAIREEMRKVSSPKQPLSPQQAARRAQERAELAAAATRAALSKASNSPSAAAQRGMGFDYSAVGGVPSLGRSSMSKDSKAALEALARDMEVLEQKKRAVEQLARTLEPPSDNEDDEDDGFPLQ